MDLRPIPDPTPTREVNHSVLADVVEPKHDAADLMAALRATGMAQGDALAQIVGMMGPEAANPLWDAFLVDTSLIADAVTALDAIATVCPVTANAWLGYALKPTNECLHPLGEWPRFCSRESGISLEGRAWITSLPDDCLVIGDLNLSRCVNLMALPRNLQVKGELAAVGCRSIQAIGEGLRVQWDLYMARCRSLAALPQDMKVAGGIHFEGCTSLIEIPAGWRAGGGIPEGGGMGSGLHLADCISLTRLPDDLKVHGVMELKGCVSLAGLPHGLEVKDTLYLRGCTSLKSLPDDLKVGASLWLDGCTSLTHCPDGLGVGGSLGMEGCTALGSLPKALRVGGDLILTACASWDGILPPDAQVNGSVTTDERVWPSIHALRIYDPSLDPMGVIDQIHPRHGA